jgi:hypothetical protein
MLHFATYRQEGLYIVELTKESKKQIVVLQRGWVVVGDVHQDGDHIVVENASVIRYWGTKAGIGELVNGPLAGTKLDPAGTITAHALAVVFTLDVVAEKWAA